MHSSSDSDSDSEINNKSRKKNTTIISSTSEEEEERDQEPSLIKKFRVEAERKKKTKKLSRTQCTICQKKVRDSYFLRVHMQSQHPETNEKSLYVKNATRHSQQSVGRRNITQQYI